MYRDLQIYTVSNFESIQRTFSVIKNDLDDQFIDQLFCLISIQFNALHLINPYDSKNKLSSFLKNLGNEIQFTFISNMKDSGQNKILIA